MRAVGRSYAAQSGEVLSVDIMTPTQLAAAFPNYVGPKTLQMNEQNYTAIQRIKYNKKLDKAKSVVDLKKILKTREA